MFGELKAINVGRPLPIVIVTEEESGSLVAGRVYTSSGELDA